MICKLDFKDVLIVPKKTTMKSRRDVSIKRKITFKNGKTWEGVPVISSNMDSVTNYKTCDVLRKHDFISCFPKYLNKIFLSDKIPFPNSYMLSCGTLDEDVKIIKNIINKTNILFICIDVANGYMDSLNRTCRHLRDCFPGIVIVAGNVVTPDAVEGLIKSGADIVKIGIGSGSVCETRLKAGVGYPQLSAILECSKVAHANGGYIISDGGIIHPCDIVKAFGAGADFVMCGSIFAGHDESPGEYTSEGKKLFYGMASDTAMDKYNNGKMGYRTAEGKTVQIQGKGPLENTLNDICGSIRSACTYTNSRNIEDLQKNVEFIKVNNHHNTIYQ
jgi:GMP reductase